jgi:hypothetical protein
MPSRESATDADRELACRLFNEAVRHVLPGACEAPVSANENRFEDGALAIAHHTSAACARAVGEAVEGKEAAFKTIEDFRDALNAPGKTQDEMIGMAKRYREHSEEMMSLDGPYFKAIAANASLTIDVKRLREQLQHLLGNIILRVETLVKFIDDPNTLLNSDPTELIIVLVSELNEASAALAPKEGEDEKL